MNDEGALKQSESYWLGRFVAAARLLLEAIDDEGASDAALARAIGLLRATLADEAERGG